MCLYHISDGNSNNLFLHCCLHSRSCPKTDPNFKQLVAFATQNFDTFEDQGTALDGAGRRRVDRNNLDQFYDYHYRRTRKPQVPLPDFN